MTCMQIITPLSKTRRTRSLTPTEKRLRIHKCASPVHLDLSSKLQLLLLQLLLLLLLLLQLLLQLLLLLLLLLWKRTVRSPPSHSVNSVNPAWNSLPNVILLLCYRDPCSSWLLRDRHHGRPRVWRCDFRCSFSRSAGVLLGKRGAHGSRYSRWTGPAGLLQQWDSYARSGSPRSTRYSTARCLLVYVSGVSTTGRVRQVNKSPLFAVKYSFISEQLVLWSSPRLQAPVDNGVYESTENVYEDIPTSATKKKGKTDGKKRKGPPKSQSTHGRREIRFVNSRYNHISRNTSKHL